MADKIEVDIKPNVDQSELAKQQRKMTKVLAKGIEDASTSGGGSFFSQLGGHLKESALSAVGGMFGRVGASALQGAAVGGPAGAIVGASSAAISSGIEKITGFFERLPELAGKANPGVTKLWLQTFEDIDAVIGKRAIPIVQYWTQEVRLLGDFLTSILPSTEQFAELIKEHKPILDEVRQILTDIAPLIRLGLITGLKVATAAFKVFIKILTTVVDLIKKIPGYDVVTKLAGGKQLESSLGAAAFGSPQIVGGMDLHKQTVIAALSTGADYQKDTADNTGRAVDVLEKIRDAVSGGGQYGSMRNWHRRAGGNNGEMSESNLPGTTN